MAAKEVSTKEATTRLIIMIMTTITIGFFSRQGLSRMSKLVNVPIVLLLLSSALIVEIATLNHSNILVDATSCLPEAFRIDCHPDLNPNQEECLRRGCCWQEDKSQQEYQLPLVGKPSCFFPSDYDCYDFKSIELEEEEHQQQQQQQHLEKDNAVKSEQNDSNDNNNNKDESFSTEQESLLQRQKRSFGSFRLIRTRKQSCSNLSSFTDEASLIEVEITVHGNSLLNIKISEPDKARFEPSLPEIKLPKRNEFQKRDYIYDKNGRRWLKIDQLLVGLVNQQQQQQRHDDLYDEYDKNDVDKRGKFNTSSESSSESSSSSASSSHLNSPYSVLKLIHPSSGVVLFETDLAKLIYSRQFIQLPTYLPSSYIYGFGQHMGDSLLKTSENYYAKSYTMFNYGHPPKPDGKTAYSSYPFYINLAQLNYDDHDHSDTTKSLNKSENFEWKRKIMATGGLMLNSNAMDILLHSNIGDYNGDDGNGNDNDKKKESQDKSNQMKEDRTRRDKSKSKIQRAALTWRLTGGLVNLFIFVGPSPHEVVDQYQTLVGAPTLPSPWTLGYHQSRLNYRDLMAIKLAWARTRYSGIPIESIWTDIDFLWRGTSYSLDNLELNQLINTFKDDFDMHYVSIVDPAISIKEEMSSYEPFKLAKSFDLFATTYLNKDNESMSDKESKIATVTTWTESKKSALLDFTNPLAVDYLKFILNQYKQQLNFDGLWLDMNEPEVFSNEPDENGIVCSNDESLPYLPGKRNLNDRTLCMSANFYAGQHKNIHNLYAFYQSKAHFEALKALNQSMRPFIISRSQFVGQGKYSGTWLGDLDSSYEHLRWSLIGMIESNWFGQPLVGADICGFFGTPTDDLCARWFSLGSFYPLSRNHNEGSSKDQDPGSLGEQVQRAARVALLRRYSMLPYIYSLFYENYLKTRPVIRSILFEFFGKFFLTLNLEDLPQIDDQFMLGSAIMIAPILDEDKESRSVYIPPGKWYDLSIGLPGTNMNDSPYNALISNWPQVYKSKRVVNLRKLIECNNEKGCWMKDQYTPVGSLNIYLRGGHIIPTFYEFSHETSINSLWKEASFFLEIALDENQGAVGSLYWDDGYSEPEAVKYNYANFWVSKNRLVISALEERSSVEMKFNGFIVYGVEKTDNFTASIMYKDVLLKYKYFGDTKVLTCQFVSPSNENELLQSLIIKRFDSLIFTW